jgi:hypothetical protein
MDRNEWIRKLEMIDSGLPLYKNSKSYESSDWRDYKDLTEPQPVQRKLTLHECVFDLDHVAPIHFESIPEWLKITGLKFIAWKSGHEGIHIHFWTDIHGKYQKKQLVEIMARKIEERFGVKNDLGPMGHQHIRAEYSYHPQKGYQKVLLFDNLNELFPINHIPVELKSQIDAIDTAPVKGKVGMRNGCSPTCIKYILSHQFADGRNRLLFAVVSWFKANGLSDQEVFDKAYEWSKRQGGRLYPRFIWATIRSNNGTVGCTYRHAVLEELGVDMSKCKWE